MKKVIEDVLLSLNNKKEGYSGKKLTALALVVCVVAAHVKWMALGDFTQLVTVLLTDFGFISVLFGLNEYGKTITKETPKDPPNEP